MCGGQRGETQESRRKRQRDLGSEVASVSFSSRDSARQSPCFGVSLSEPRQPRGSRARLSVRRGRQGPDHAMQCGPWGGIWIVVSYCSKKPLKSYF